MHNLRKDRCGSEKVCAYPICGGSECNVYAHNKNGYPITISIDIKAENLRYRKKDNNVFVLLPNEKRRVKRLLRGDLVSGYALNVSSRWMMGSYLSVPDTHHVYRLPFRKGKAYQVGQGYHGKFTHQGQWAYSIDFGMSAGDTVAAARGGIVIRVEDGHSKGCPQVECRQYGNSVEILHEDGTIASYSHLMKDGALVKAGDTVAVGQNIGLSGATGRVTGPHLHFSIFRPVGSEEYRSIPAIFATSKGAIKELKEEEVYSH